MDPFDFSQVPDYSDEDCLPLGDNMNLHFQSRFVVIFNKNGELHLVAFAHYTHYQHNQLSYAYSIHGQMEEGETLYAFWGGLNQGGQFAISSSGSERLEINPNGALEKKFFANKEAMSKLEILMPNIKVLKSVAFKVGYMR